MYRRAPFIWIGNQEVDDFAEARAFATGELRRETNANRWYLFRRVFELSSAPEGAEVAITVDGRYQLFVNGRRVGRGPARCDPLHQRVDTYEIADALRAGINAFAVLVRVYGVDTSWYQTVKGHWHLVFGDGGLYVDGRIRCGGRDIDILGDESWRGLPCDAWEADTPRANWGLGFIEVHDAQRMPVGWTEPDFDDSGWCSARVLRAGGGGPDGMLGGMSVEPFPTLMRREIPFLAERPQAPVAVLRQAGVVPRPDCAVDDRIYAEELVEPESGQIEAAEALLSPRGASALLRTTATRDVAVLADFGRIHAGYPFIDIEASGGEVVEVAVAEGIPGEWDGSSEAPRLDKTRAHGAHVFRYVARPGRQRFERFEWTGVRYAQLTVRNAPAGLRIHHLGSLATTYPVEERGSFECSDEMLNRLWQVGRYTLQQCMHDGWEDCPSREQRQWAGDATVEYLVAQAAFGPCANALNRQFLLHLAESQRVDGLTQMFAPGDHHEYALIIPDWTLQWILNAERYLRYSGDVGTIEEIFPAVQRALAWFERQIGPNDLVADLPYWHFMDWAALGRRGEAAPLNAEVAGAFRAAARLAAALESARAARRYEQVASRLCAALSRRHWDENRGVYVDCVDPASGARDARVSQHANAAMILWGRAPESRWASMVARITDPARLRFTAAPPIAPTGEAFDAETDVVLANTFYSHFVYRALSRAGRFDRALALMRERYGRMLARGATTLWESFDPSASLCHGFSATPVYQLSAEVLGIHPLADGFARFRVRPQPADLQFARGAFPTVRGDVSVRWERRADRIELGIDVPPDTEAIVQAPSGWAVARGTGSLAPGRHVVEYERRA